MSALRSDHMTGTGTDSMIASKVLSSLFQLHLSFHVAVLLRPFVRKCLQTVEYSHVSKRVYTLQQGVEIVFFSKIFSIFNSNVFQWMYSGFIATKTNTTL